MVTTCILTVHANRILASSDTHTRRHHTVKSLLRQRPARQCAALSRKSPSLSRPRRQHRQVSVARPHFFWIFFLLTSAIVGSAGWLAARSANPTASPTPSSTRKSKKAAPSDTASVVSSGPRSTKSFSPPSAPSPAPSSVMANYRAKNDGACTYSDSFLKANAHV